ncbi:hypothetical protein A2U01_0091974, partial [Trifolium medium]|nr:hypothetical protein [Trifolium medium]
SCLKRSSSEDVAGGAEGAAACDWFPYQRIG